MANPFGLYGLYYDLLYHDKNYSLEAAYVGALLRTHGIPGSKLLEFGAGTGKHARALAQLGFEVTGIERSPSMISMSRQNGYHQIIEGDVRKSRVPGLFDGVISLFHVMSYQTEEDDLTAVFQNASGHLEPQ
ncbi:MAG: class I SAM-dependent DNA methyltransferase, partial [Bacteroidia bacterium]